jgi:hypothetical protein
LVEVRPSADFMVNSVTFTPSFFACFDAFALRVCSTSSPDLTTYTLALEHTTTFFADTITALFEMSFNS